MRGVRMVRSSGRARCRRKEGRPLRRTLRKKVGPTDGFHQSEGHRIRRHGINSELRCRKWTLPEVGNFPNHPPPRPADSSGLSNFAMPRAADIGVKVTGSYLKRT